MMRKVITKEHKSLIGEQFGYLTVIGKDVDEIDKNGHKVYKWLCTCKCGNKISVKECNLKYGSRKSCGCLQKERAGEHNKKDLSGQRFGRLYVICKVEPYISPQNKKLTQYLCCCDCGNQKIVIGSHLTGGLTTSCGCHRREATSQAHSSDLLHQRFGMLTVIEKVGSENKNNQKRILWQCKCDCGNEVILNTNVLTCGNTSSCGCRRYFKGEEKIKDYLISHKIKFERQKGYDDLRGNKGGKLRYDFYIPEYNLLIEYQGVHHYKVTNFSGNQELSEQNFKEQKINDEIKREYAISHNINFLEISYTDYDDIDIILDRKID